MALGLSTAALSQTAPKFRRPAGAGAFPLSFTHTAAWFINDTTATHKQLALLVFFRGTAGWHTKGTRFKWQVAQDPASIDMSVGGVPIDIQYSSKSGSVEIGRFKSNVAVANVYLVDGVDTNPSTKPLGVHDLTFKDDELPPVALLQRSASIWSLITGNRQDEHWKARQASAEKQVIQLDADGLKLISSENAAEQQQGFELLRRAAERGYAAAQYRLGYCYETGTGVSKNELAANEWYEKAALKGHVDAQYKLGHSYRVGRGTKIDLAAAISWYKKAGARGDADALHNLGWMYATGQGVTTDPAIALHWFEESALHGETVSQFEVSRRFRQGDGTTVDLVRSYAWLLVLDTQRERFAPDDWKQVSDAQIAIEAQLDSTKKAGAERLAAQFMQTIAENEMKAIARPQGEL